MAVFKRVDFYKVAQAALSYSEAICQRWLPDGRKSGHEWVALNPRRADRHKGNFKINLSTGAWADFASGDRGRDLISLAAFIHNISQREAAIAIAQMIGIDPHE